jgi:Raf kinase inhibitor-like YbhB/YbcL family protein
MSFTIKTTSFKDNGEIPLKYTCDGENISPPLQWEGFPNETKSFVLIVDDPDAPLGTWNHWIIYNIPENITKLEENIKILPGSAKLGKNSWGKDNYGGPCPSKGEHRYYFKLYSLDKKIESELKISRANIGELIKYHIIDEGILMGRYSRKITI